MRWRDLLILIEFPFQTYLEDMKIWIGFVFLLNWWQIIPKSNMFKALQFSLLFYNIMFIFWMHIQFLDLLIIDLVSFAFVMCLCVQGMKLKGKNSCCYSFHDIKETKLLIRSFSTFSLMVMIPDFSCSLPIYNLSTHYISMTFHCLYIQLWKRLLGDYFVTALFPFVYCLILSFHLR